MSRVENKIKPSLIPFPRNINVTNPSGWYNIGNLAEYYGNPTVHSLIIDKFNPNIIYAGGIFNAINDVSMNYVSQYNVSTNSWSDLNGGVNYAVNCLAQDASGMLYVGGEFSEAGTLKLQVPRFAKYNPFTSTWFDISFPGTNKVYQAVMDLSNNLYVTSGNNLYKYITSTGTWNTYTGPNAITIALACDLSNSIYIGGSFSTVGSRIAKWIGTSDTSGYWSNPFGLGITSGGTVFSIQVDLSNNAYITGNFSAVNGVSGYNYIAKWNGNDNSWFPANTLGSGINQLIYDTTIDTSNNLYLTGIFTEASGLAVNYITRFNTNGSFSGISGGLNSGGQAILVDASRNIYVGGYFTAVGNPPKSAISIAKFYQDPFISSSSGIYYILPNKNFYRYSTKIGI